MRLIVMPTRDETVHARAPSCLNALDQFRLPAHAGRCHQRAQSTGSPKTDHLIGGDRVSASGASSGQASRHPVTRIESTSSPTVSTRKQVPSLA
jgi:hypothetical protein